MSGYIQPSPQQMAEIMKLPKDKPVVMINLLKFKALTEDGQSTGFERYIEYSKAVMPFLKAAGAEIIYMGEAYPTIIGEEEEHWHHVALVKYPNIDKFLNMIQAHEYPHELRSSALEDSRLIPSMNDRI